MHVLLHAAVFTYQGFNWYLGNAGATCDDTCNNHYRNLGFDNDDPIYNHFIRILDNNNEHHNYQDQFLFYNYCLKCNMDNWCLDPNTFIEDDE